MKRRSYLVARASRFVQKMLEEQLPAWAVYHGVAHTREVVAAAREIGRASGLTQQEMEVVLLAAWFHDTGFTVTAKGHEEKSAGIASGFLQRHGFPERGISRILRCIRATRVPQRPANSLERVLCDADLCSLGKRSYFLQNDRLKLEIEKREATSLDDSVWLRRSLRFLRNHRFHTRYARAKFEAQRRANVVRLKTIFDGHE